MNYKKDTKKAKEPFKCKFPEKYHKSAKAPMWKSLWEAKVFQALDVNPYVIEWGYEPFPIYYHNPIYMNYTVYWPDIYAHIKMDNGAEHRILSEIKPAKYCVMPKKPNAPTGQDPKKWERYRKALIRHKSDSRDYMVNMAKWNAAQTWCQKHGFRWVILNEKNTNTLFK